MKKIFLIAGMSFLIFACSTSKTGETKSVAYNLDTTSLASGTVFYQCPMHPEVLSTNQGECPKCGMALEKRTKF